MGDELTTLKRIMHNRTFVRCRTIGHQWDEIPVTKPDPDGPGIWLRCMSCTGERHDTFHRMTGELIRREYDMPEGYSFAHDEVPTRNEFRLQLFSLANDLADRRERRRKAS